MNGYFLNLKMANFVTIMADHVLAHLSKVRMDCFYFTLCESVCIAENLAGNVSFHIEIHDSRYKTSSHAYCRITKASLAKNKKTICRFVALVFYTVYAYDVIGSGENSRRR